MDIYTQVVEPTTIRTPPNAASFPIYQTSAYTFADVDEVDQLLAGKREGYSYTRGGNPNTDALAQFAAGLEGAEAGVVTSSGTAALMAGILTLLPRPGRILLAQEIYGGTVGIARTVLAPMGYQMQWVDTHDLAAVREALTGPPAVLVVETISNPLGRVCELDRIIAMAHRHGVRVLVDNTFATPFHATPLSWGADLVVHSVTKFIGGHSDLILGAVVGSKDLIARVAAVVDSAGFTPDPFAAWLALRGGRTLALRMQQASANAFQLASSLQSLKEVRRVYYPGLESHPDHVLAGRLLARGFGCIVSVSLEAGYGGVQEMVRRLRRVRFVPSLGDVATTVSHPVTASHRELTADEKTRVGIDDSVVRISVGIESSGDLIEDFTQALRGE